MAEDTNNEHETTDTQNSENASTEEQTDEKHPDEKHPESKEETADKQTSEKCTVEERDARAAITEKQLNEEENRHSTHTATDKPNEDEPPGEEKGSKYLQNIKMSSSNGGLVLSETEKSKEAPLLIDSRTVVRFSPVWKQSLASLATVLVTFTSGLTSGYSAVLLPQLKHPSSPIPGDDDTASWIASMAALPMAPGCLISGWMMEKFGRRTSHYILCIPFFFGWILIACANNLTLMLLGRFLTGLCVGLLGPLGPVYVGETSEPKYRGFFLASVPLAIALGILVAHLIGTYMTWQWTATICSLFPILAVVSLALVPESPTWLISKGRIEDGIKSFGWLRGYSEEANAELKGIIEKKKAADLEPVLSLKDKLRDLKSPELLKPLFIMIVYFVVCQFSGVNAIAFYSIDIVEKAVGKGLDRYMVMLVIDLVRVIMSVVACVVCKQYGRRPLCIVSGTFTALSMIGLSMYLYFTENKETNMVWIPLSCLMLYICAISVGLVPLPWIMCGEVFPIRMRGVGSGISSATTFAAFFVVVKTAPGMMNHLGGIVTFMFYGIISLIGTVIMYFILPETKGKSLQEIEEKFKNSSKTDTKV